MQCNTSHIGNLLVQGFHMKLVQLHMKASSVECDQSRIQSLEDAYSLMYFKDGGI